MLHVFFSSPSLAEAPVAGAAVLIQELVSNLLPLVFLLGLGMSLLCPFSSGDWIPRLGGRVGGSSGLVWNMGNKEMKSQGTIRAEVSLSLTFTSLGDDMHGIFMGSGRIINEGAWGEGSPGLCNTARTLWPSGNLFRGHSHLMGSTADPLQ